MRPKCWKRTSRRWPGRYSNVLPGDQLEPGNLNVCLSFDDGYFDFHATVFPLLIKHGLRAMLAIPPGVVRQQVDPANRDRLNVDSAEAFADPGKGGFCTWPELERMVGSGRVRLAAHGFSHVRLDLAIGGLAAEVDAPKAILESRIGRPVESFVFSVWPLLAASLQHAPRSYPYVFRIGGALNRSWNSRLPCRVDADEMKGPRSLFSPGRPRRLPDARYVWNRLRRR